MYLVYTGFMIVVLGIGLLGIYEYTLYTPTEKSNTRFLSKMYLFGMISLIGFSLVGIVLLSMNIPITIVWSGFSIILFVSFILLLVQYKMHKRMGRDKSPITEKFKRILNKRNSDDQTDMEA